MLLYFTCIETEQCRAQCAGIVVQSRFDELQIDGGSARRECHDLVDDASEEFGAPFEHAAAQEQGMRIEDGNGVGDEQAEGARRVVPEFDSIFDALFTRLLDTSRRWVFIFAQP